MEKTTNKHKLDDNVSDQYITEKKFCFEQSQVQDDNQSEGESELQLMDCTKDDKQNNELNTEFITAPQDNITETVYFSKENSKTINNEKSESSSSTTYDSVESKTNIDDIDIIKITEQSAIIQTNKIIEPKMITHTVPILKEVDKFEGNVNIEVIDSISNKQLTPVENITTNIAQDANIEASNQIDCSLPLNSKHITATHNGIDGAVTPNLSICHSASLNTKHIEDAYNTDAVMSSISISNSASLNIKHTSTVELEMEHRLDLNQDNIPFVNSNEPVESIDHDKSTSYYIEQGNLSVEVDKLPSILSNRQNKSPVDLINPQKPVDSIKDDYSHLDSTNHGISHFVDSTGKLRGELKNELTSIDQGLLGYDTIAPKNIKGQSVRLSLTSQVTEDKAEASDTQLDTKVANTEISFSKSIIPDKITFSKESQNDVISSELKLDNLTDFSGKTNNVSIQNEVIEARISSVLVENSDSLSGTFYSNDNSPAFSTPLESCQASATSSPKPFDGLVKLLDEASPKMESKRVIGKRVSAKKKQKRNAKKHIKSVSGPTVIDEETRMDANSNSTAIEIIQDEDSHSSTGTSSKREIKKFRTEVVDPESTEVFTVDKVIEYIWPLDDFGEHYFIQEHISLYLGIMSFKRRYPYIRRRFIEKTEKEYLKERGVVNEKTCDLGLTAARSEDVMDIIFNDFPDKYEELHKDLRDRKEKKFKEDGRVDYQVASLDKSKMQEYSKKAAADAARWNLAFNRERYDERRYSIDLQTFTMHRPKSRCQRLTPESTKMGSYPLAVLPGQYTDYYKKYSSIELNALPIHSVLTGPFTIEEINGDISKVTDDDSLPKKEEKSKTKIAADVADTTVTPSLDPLSAEKQPRCKECNGGRDRNKVGKPEPLIICGSCRTPSHPTCIELTLSMVKKIESYGWQCMECKTCAHCNDPNDEERMIFCDMCDRGYHIYCVGLRKVPNGRWHCRNCACCFTCGTRTPAGNEIVKVAEWQHEFKKNKETKEVNYICTLCLTCDRYWKRRMYCNSCMKVYKNLQEGGMVKCVACPKYIHREGCATLLDNEYLCNYCVKSRKNTAMNHSRILAAAKQKMAAGY